MKPNEKLPMPLRTTLALASAAVMAACASTPPNNARLEEARAAYDRATADATVARAAPFELQQAQLALRRADAAMREGSGAAAVDHQAYLARQRVEVALEAGRIAAAEMAVAESRAQRERILLDARAREAEAARGSAERARAEADAARALAEQRLAAANVAQQQASAAQQQAAASRTRADALAAQMAELKARPTERGMVLTLGDVLFDTGQATLKAGAMRTVDQLASFLQNDAARTVLIEGHTDSQGSDVYNRELSLRRAEAVRQALLARRIDGARVQVAGLGEAYPVAGNDSAAGRQQNRRVEVVFSDDNGLVRPRAGG